MDLTGRRPAAVQPTPLEPALGLLELDSIAAGIEAGDAMAKRAPVDVIRAGTVHPGKYLVLVGGGPAPGGGHRQTIRSAPTTVIRRSREKVRGRVRPSPDGLAIENEVKPSPPSPRPA